ncbi:WxL protein peptidoglycan domain-containing protein [Streptomyces sp. NPDC008139]|uniref:WxL protein peptidoglycan domain-containing protein n=1 Tax=Streptomyces sp. NPDC008139 TaxID=3364814 RepID=UPI0036E1A98E
MGTPAGTPAGTPPGVLPRGRARARSAAATGLRALTATGAAAAVGLAALLGPAAGPAGAADNGRWSVFPAPAAGAADPSATGQERQFFTLQADPGATVKDKVSVSNLSTAPMTFRLYGADAYNTPRDGGFAVRGPDETNRDVGTWIRLAKTTLTVPPRTRADIPFTLTVPANASPGDHPGAIVALDTRTDEGSGKVAVGVRRAVGARVYLRVGGPSLAALSVEHLTVSHGDPLLPGTGSTAATIHYTLVNRGNVTLSPRLAVKATGLFGRTLLNRPARDLPLELLPGQQVSLTEKWAGAPAFDRVSVRLTVSTATGGVDERDTASYLVAPWLAVALVLAGLAVPAVWYVRRRRSRHPAAEAAEAASGARPDASDTYTGPGPRAGADTDTDTGADTDTDTDTGADTGAESGPSTAVIGAPTDGS